MMEESQQIAPFMFNFHLIPEKGRGSKEWLTLILILQKNFCQLLKCQSLETALFVTPSELIVFHMAFID